MTQNQIASGSVQTIFTYNNDLFNEEIHFQYLAIWPQTWNFRDALCLYFFAWNFLCLPTERFKNAVNSSTYQKELKFIFMIEFLTSYLM